MKAPSDEDEAKDFGEALKPELSNEFKFGVLEVEPGGKMEADASRAYFYVGEERLPVEVWRDATGWHVKSELKIHVHKGEKGGG